MSKELSEIQVAWNIAALQILISDIEALVNFVSLAADTTAQQRKAILEFQERMWETL